MKKMRFLLIFICFVSIFAFAGCGDKELEPANILRDDARTGGSLSFVYDKNLQTVYVGGEEEIVQYSQANESKGLEEGCRIGLKVIAPSENLDFENSTLEMNGINYSSGDFLESINGNKQPFFNIYPVVSKENKIVKFSVVWQDGIKKQDFKIIVVEGTRFMDKDGNVK